MTSHQPFRTAYIHAALAFAVFGGFSLGAHIALPMGFGWNLPPFYHIWVQMHGHLQLMGWTGLFIIGVSLYFMPRFLKVPLPDPASGPLILIAGGLVLRTAATFTLPYLEPGTPADLSIWTVRIAAILEWSGVMLYLRILVTLYRKKPAGSNGIKTVKPFFLMMGSGFFLYSSLHLIQVFAYDVSVRLPWNAFLIELFIGLVLFPVAFAFSLRTFPLFMQTSPLKDPFHIPGAVYFFCTVAALTPALIPGDSPLPGTAGSVLQILRFCIVILLVVRIKIIQKMFLSPRAFMDRYYGTQYAEERVSSTAFNKARPGYYDFGQYGRFELLIYSSYIWLVLYAVLEIAAAGGRLAGYELPFGHDPVRHIFLLGYVTLLIAGMAQRMLPGFMHKKGIGFRRVVFATFVLGNLAVLSRVLPMLLPASLLSAYPAAGRGLLYAFGVSGLFMIAGLLLLWVNLIVTFRR